MAKKRTQAETRQAILETAELLFRRSSYDAVSVTDIAQHCLMTPGNIYHVFRNKADIAEAILRRSLEALLEGWDTEEVQAAELRGHLAQIVLSTLRHLDQNTDPFLFDLWRRAAVGNWGIWETLTEELRVRISARLGSGGMADAPSLLSDAVFRASLAFVHPALIADEHWPTLEEEAALLFTRIERQHIGQRVASNEKPGRRLR